MKVAGRARRGVYVSDGTINVALLKQDGEREARHLPFRHLGGRSRRGREESSEGRRHLSRRTADIARTSFYEAKYKDPNGIVFDLTHNGWVGAVKDVVRERRAAARRLPDARTP